MEELRFHADAAIIDRLGRELVARQETALIELVKNAYDADATNVTVTFEGRGGPSAVLEVKDNGTGMTRQDLLSGFLRLASNLKVAQPVSPKYRRMRAGRKGIGRFSAQRLGSRLILTTQAESDSVALQLTADWTQFISGRRLDDVVVTLQTLPITEPGTTVRIEGLHDKWTDSQIRSCWRGVLALQQPFPVAPLSKRQADPGFKVSFVDSGGLYEDSSVIADMQTELLNHLPVVIEMRVDGKGAASWRISKNAFGERRRWQPIHHNHRESRDPPNYDALRNVSMKAYHVILHPSLLPKVIFSRVRDIQKAEGGIRLYRNGFRVTPYGSENDDWLRLDEAYGRRDFLAPVANRNFFGVIEVHDPEGIQFEEHTSREGLIETPAFTELKDLASSVLITAGSAIQADRKRKIRTGSDSPRPETREVLSRARAAMRAAREATEQAVRIADIESTREAVSLVAKAEEAVIKEEASLVEQRQQLADEAAMMRLLSSLGMVTAEFSHETGMSLEAFRLDLERVFDVALEAKGNDHSFAQQAQRARDALKRLEALTGYLNATVASRALREVRPVSLSKAVEDFARGMGAHAQTQATILEIRTPPLDALYTCPMHEAELASVLLNFHTNALKAVRRTSGDRRLLVVADRDTPAFVRLRFSDTGDGVPDALRERIFEPFFSTRVAPSSSAGDLEHAQGTGLGLWIVQQIAQSAGGEVKVSDPPTGFSTCFEMRLPAERSDG